jgi:hypothetical protein
MYSIRGREESEGGINYRGRGRLGIIIFSRNKEESGKWNGLARSHNKG